jgi:hypothetical protein
MMQPHLRGDSSNNMLKKKCMQSMLKTSALLASIVMAFDHGQQPFSG